MAIKSNPEYVNFFEVLPANEADASAEADAAEVEADDEVDPEKALEDDELSLDDEVDPEEPDSEEEAEDEPKSESKKTEEEDKTKSKDDAEPELSDEDKRKAHNREMAERRIQEKQKRSETLKEAQQEYIAEADKEDPHDIAIRQLNVDAYNNTVERNTNKLENGYQKALKDFDILNDEDPAIQREIDATLDAFQAQHVSVDKYGNPTEVRGDLYEFLQAKADSIRELTGKGARQQAKAKGKEKSKSFTPPTRAPKEKAKDADLEAFDEEANRY